MISIHCTVNDISTMQIFTYPLFQWEKVNSSVFNAIIRTLKYVPCTVHTERIAYKNWQKFCFLSAMFAYRCILCNWTTPLLQSEMCNFSLSFEYSVCIHTQTFLNWNAHSIHCGCVMHNLEPCYELGENANICYIFSFGRIRHFQLQHKPINPEIPSFTSK